MRRNGKRMRMALLPGADGFMEEYSAAVAKLDGDAKRPKRGRCVGTMGWLANEFEHSHDFLKCDERERRVRHQIVEALLHEETKEGSGKRFRDCPIRLFTPDHVRLLRDRKVKAGTPGAANNRLKQLRIILAWGMEERSAYVKRNVAADVKTVNYEKEPFTLGPRKKSRFCRRVTRSAPWAVLRSTSCSTPGCAGRTP